MYRYSLCFINYINKKILWYRFIFWEWGFISKMVMIIGEYGMVWGN